jgi:hypothetical protein
MVTPWADALRGTNIAKPKASALTKMADDFLIDLAPSSARATRLAFTIKQMPGTNLGFCDHGLGASFASA